MKFIQDIELSGVHKFTVVNPNLYILVKLIDTWMARQ